MKTSLLLFSFCVACALGIRFYMLYNRSEGQLFTYEDLTVLNGGEGFVETANIQGVTTWMGSEGVPTRIIDVKGATNGFFRHHSSASLRRGQTFSVRSKRGSTWVSWSVPDDFSGEIICDAFENMDNELLLIARETISKGNGVDGKERGCSFQSQ